MKAQHTPGPWNVSEIESGCFIASETESGDVARVYMGSGKFTAEYKANARLIAAAPELLEALSKLSSMVSQDESEYPDFGVYQLMMKADERAKQAIKRALEG